MSKRGALLVFEGCDRSGKSTQCRKLLESLKQRNVKAEFMAFPDRSTTVGNILDRYLQKKSDIPDHTVHLLFSANRWELEPRMRELLNKGVTLIVDRYAFSGVAFSATKKGMDFEWCKTPDTGLPKPDAVFQLVLGLDAISKRGGFGGERYETTDFQRAVAKNFSRLRDDSWRVIEADRDIETLHEEILSHALKVIERSQSTTLGQLW